jgi:hypothetical protein
LYCQVEIFISNILEHYFEKIKWQKVFFAKFY